MSEAQKYRMTFGCLDCGHTFKKVTTNQNLNDPKCPECKGKKPKNKKYRIGDGAVTDETLRAEEEGRERNKNRKKVFGIGGSNYVKAVDTTADIVMQDHGMTDLRTDMRAGESQVPKLPPALQAQVDGMFSGGAATSKSGKKSPIDRQKIISKINSGSLLKRTGGDIAQQAVQNIARPKVNIEASYNG